MNRNRRRLDSRGTSTLELVLVLPTLFLVIFGGIELSRAWFTLNLLTTAAREGARIGTVTNPFSKVNAVVRMQQILDNGGLTNGARTVDVTCAAPCAPDSVVQARITYPFTTVFPTLLPGLGGFTLTQTASMRYE
jgi:Flp pilus assembly protein TadG